MVYCADCGKPMRLHRTRTKEEDSYNNFKCSTYSNRGKEACSGHYIRESQLKAIVLDDLRRVTQFARQKENLLLRHVAKRNSAQAKKEIGQLQRELDRLRRRETELTALFKRLYEDNVLGRSRTSSTDSSPPNTPRSRHRSRNGSPSWRSGRRSCETPLPTHPGLWNAPGSTVRSRS